MCDVIRRSKQIIFVTRDAFSDFVIAILTDSEEAQSLKSAIISTTSNTRRSSNIVVRTDSAPGFKSLHLNKNKDLEELGIKIESLLWIRPFKNFKKN